MRQRDVSTVSFVGVVVIVGALLATALLVVLLSGCHPLPDPQTPPGPGPVDPPVPDPGSAATACERAAATWVRLGCDPLVDFDTYADLCQRNENLGGAYSYRPDCQAKATTCAQLEGCRGGT